MTVEPTQAIRILFVEDLEVDAERALHHLKRAGLNCVWRRVETEQGLIDALAEFSPMLILSDFAMPEFDGMSALRVARERAPSVPFMFLSGTIGEEKAVEALHSGAADYVLKHNMIRLAPAVKRALGDAVAKIEKTRQEAQIARLNRVLLMLSGINSLVLRIRDRTELFQETCRLATSVGGYAAAIASSKVAGVASIQPVAWSGVDEKMTERLRTYIAAAAGRQGSVLAEVLRTGKPFVCNNTADQSATATFDTLMVHAGMLSVVALPLLVDNTPVATLVLTARESDALSAKEMEMLREVAGNLSFGLQFMQRDSAARFLSHFNPQTSLARRSLFCERVERQIAAAGRQRTQQGIVVMDIERLSIINDSFGRRTGDLVLQHVADRLKRHYPQNDQIGHFGGGTFALIRPQGERKDEEVLAAAHQQAEAVFGEPFLIEGRTIPVAIRTGFALFPADGVDATALVQNSEAALRNARAAGEKHRRYDAAARLVGVDQLAMEHRLRLALERQEFELHYQPKVNVVTRRLQGAEALIRWRSPQDGLVPPGAFLPLLEATGLIVQVGDWVIQQAARDCHRWMMEGLPPVRIAVNIAPAQLRHPDFVRKFLQAANSWSTGSWGLDVEITEGVLQEDSLAEVRKLKLLRETGVRIAIDDFGTGYSSLSRLSTLPIDTLKIDRSFVVQSRNGACGKSLVKTIIDLARAFNLKTVAEGVEKQEELDFLWQVHCDQSQGFLHSPALAADDFAQILKHGKGKFIHAAEPAQESDRAANGS